MNLVGNIKARELLDKAKQNDNLSHAYLFCGPEGVGKTSFAVEFARKLLCENTEGGACGVCESCKLLALGNNPDFLLYDSRENMGVDEIRELIRMLDLSPYRAKYKVIIIANFERVTDQGMNSFLKTLEEPSKTTKIILTAKSKKNLLPTIVSRTQVINFKPTNKKTVQEFIVNNFSIEDKIVDELVDFSSGRIGNAVKIADNLDRYQEKRLLCEEFIDAISSKDINEKFRFAEKITKEKEILEEVLDFLEFKIRKNVLENSSNMNNNGILKEVKMMDSIQITKDLLKRNINARLAIESLLLAN